MPGLSIITPTVGRPTFGAMLESAAPQMTPDDEHIIVADGRNAEVAAVIDAAWKRWRMNGLYVETEPPTRQYGNYQRHIAIDKAKRGNWLLFLDDDDVLLPGALDRVRQAIEAYPDKVLMFRLQSWGYYGVPNGYVSWRVPEIRIGGVGGSNIVCRNEPGMLGDWNGTSDLQDYIFIAGTVRQYPPGSVEWIDEVIIECRPHLKNNSRQNGSSTPLPIS